MTRLHVLFTVAVVCSFGTCFTSAVAQPGDSPPPLVAVAAVVEKSVTPGTSVVCTVVPTRRSIVGAAVDGRVETFLATDAGANEKLTDVHRGQALAQLKTETIQLEAAAAHAEFELRTQELLELQNGARVEEIAAAKAQAKQRLSEHEYASARLERLQALYKERSGVSLDQLQSAQAQVAQAEQAHLAASANLQLIEAGPRAEQIAQATARAVAAEHQAKRLDEMLAKFTIRAPFDGFVVKEFTEVGAWVKQGDPIAEVIQLQPVEVEIAVSETQVPRLRIGDVVRVTLNAIRDRVFKGRIQRITPQADVRSRTFPVRVRLPSDLKPSEMGIMAGMLGRVDVDLDDQQSLVLVPKDAVVLGGKRLIVVVVDPDDSTGPEATFRLGRAKHVAVRLGTMHETWVEVGGEIRPGQWVIVRGNERIRPDSIVRWQELH